MKKKYLWFTCLLLGLMVVDAEAAGTKYFSPNGKKVSQNEYMQLQDTQAQRVSQVKEDAIRRLQEEKDEEGRPLYDSKGRRIYYSTFEPEDLADTTPPPDSGMKTTTPAAEPNTGTKVPPRRSAGEGTDIQEHTDWQKTTDDARQKSRSRVRLLN
jgi:hypothetical protein